MTDSVTDSVTDETQTVQGRDGCDGFLPNSFNAQFTDTDFTAIAYELARAAEAGDGEIFRILVDTYHLDDYPDQKRIIWGKLSRDEKAAIKSLTEKMLR